MPFVAHSQPFVPVVDDAHKPNQFANRLAAFFGIHSSQPVSDIVGEYELAPPDEPDARPFEASEPVVELQVVLPADTDVRPLAAQRLLLTTRSCSWPVAFEVVGTESSVTVQYACRASDARILRQQLLGQFADAVIVESKDYLRQQWLARRRSHRIVVDFGLSEEFIRPLQVFNKLDVDPLTSIVAGLSDLEDEETAVLQVLFAHTRAPWTTHVLRSVTDQEGRSFFVDAPEMLSLAKEKVESPLYAAVIRIGIQSPNAGRMWTIARTLAGAFTQFSAPMSNGLIPLVNEDYPSDLHEADLLARETHRSGMLLNVEELSGLVHPPSSAVQSEKLARHAQRTRRAPTTASGHSLLLGSNIHRGTKRPVSIAEDVRLRHMHVLGASGTGKSTLLLDLILQDINKGSGLAVLDPHGDLIDQIVGNVPESRVKDVILIDPADAEYPVAFNILSAHSELEKTLLSSDLVALFRRFTTSWGDQMTAVLGNAVLAFLESRRGGSLVDLRRFLIEPDFREEFLETVTDPQVAYFWRQEFALLPGRPQAAILTRLDTFLRPKTIRAMVSQRESRLDFASIMDEGKVVLVKLSHGAIGEENASILGTLLVAKIHQLVMGRQQQTVGKRRSFFLYIDEFHNFLTPSLASLLSGARKYGLGLILAHQEMGQLLNADRDVAGAVLANAATRICFRLGDDDAKRLQKGFTSFDAQDLMNLGRGEAICRIDQSSADFNLKTRVPPLVGPSEAAARREEIISFSRETYASRIQSPPVEPVAAEEVRDITRPPAALKVDRKSVQRVAAIPAPVDLPVLPGRGGPQHKYVQNLIKRWAESRGFLVTVEKPVLDGLGQVDVALEKGDRRIACEISISTGDAHEIGNIQKCLAADFTDIVLLTVEKRRVAALAKAVNEQLGDESGSRVHVLTVDDLFGYLEQPEDSEPKTVRGYTVRVKQTTVGKSETSRRQAIAQTVLGAIRRLAPRK